MAPAPLSVFTFKRISLKGENTVSDPSLLIPTVRTSET